MKHEKETACCSPWLSRSAEILAKVGTDVDRVYVRFEQAEAYWVKGEETGSVGLW